MPVTEWSESIVIVDLSDEPSFSDDMHALAQRLHDGGGNNHSKTPHVILNMKGVTYLNSSNLAQLLKLRKNLQLKERRLRICAVNDAVWSVMITTGLDGVFNFTEDVSTSLASLQIS